MRPVTSLDDFRAARARVTVAGGRGTIRVLRPDNVVPLRRPELSHCPAQCRAIRVTDPTVCLLPDGSRRCAAAQLRARAS